MSRFARAVIEFVTNARQASGDVASVDKEVKALGGGLKDASKGFNELKETAAKFAGLGAAVAAVATGIAVGIDSFLNRRTDLQSELDDLNRGLTETADRLAKLSAAASSPASGKSIAAPLLEGGAAIKSAGDQAQSTMSQLGRAFRFMGQRLIDDQLGVNWVNGLRETERATEASMNRVATIAAREARKERERQKKAEEDAVRDRAKSVMEEVESATIAQLSGVERISAEEQRALAKIAVRRAEAKSDEERDALDSLAKLTAADAARRRQDVVAAKVAAEQKAQDEKAAQIRASQEAAKAAADALTKEVGGALTRLMDQQRAFSNSQISNIAADVTRISDLISARLRSNAGGA